LASRMQMAAAERAKRAANAKKYGDYYADAYGTVKFRRHDSQGRVIPVPEAAGREVPVHAWEEP
jgi:hypothetical protein